MTSIYIWVLLPIVGGLLYGCTRPAPTISPVSPSNLLQSSAEETATPTALPDPTIPPPTPTPLPAVQIHAADDALFYGDWQMALEEYQAVMGRTEDSNLLVEAALGSARAHVLARDDLRAIQLLEELVKEYPDANQIASAYFELGQAYERQDRLSEAIEYYTKFIDTKPGAIDAYLLDRRGDVYFDSGNYLAAADDYQRSLSEPSVLDEIQQRLKMARAYTLEGDYPTALSLYDDISLRTEDDYTRALIDLRKGQIYTEIGQLENAYAAYQHAVNNYPKSYDTYSALIALLDGGIDVDLLQRGIIDYYAGQYGPAAAALDQYLQKEPLDQGTARYYYGLTSSAQGNYEAAVQQWDYLIDSESGHLLIDEAIELKAYTLWANLNQFDAAIDTLIGFTTKAPGDQRAAEFLFDAALIAERDNQLDRAIEIWENQASLYPEDERTNRSRFLAAVTRFRMADFQGAEKSFERFIGTTQNLEEKAAGNYWLGKVLSEKEDLESAKLAWQTAAAIDPTGYYSERARDQLRNRSEFDAPEYYDLTYDAAEEKRKAADWVKLNFNLPDDTELLGPGDLVNDPYLRRGLELWQLGLYDEARAEFEVLRATALSDPARSFRMMNLFLDIGAYRPAIMAARQVLNLAGLDDAGTLSAPAYFNHVRFGAYYGDLIMPLAGEYNFHPLFLFALIRQESLFEGFVRSSAGARGLMQIIPTTGSEVAANLGWPEDFDPEDLYRPIVSLRLGVDYLNRQRDLFDGDLYAALAAYNGGPGNAQEWFEIGKDDPDLFMELVRYEETRLYIRRIYENFAIYRWLYDRTP